MRPATDTLPSADSSTDDATSTPARRLSVLADTLLSSEILRIAAEVREKREQGVSICDLTIGDFGATEFPVPDMLLDGTVDALRKGETKYPPSTGLPILRKRVAEFYERELGLSYGPEGVLVTCGSRPGIYATYKTLVDPGDRVVYPVPSWNNNYYCHLVGGTDVPVPAASENAFLPTAEQLAPKLRGARLLVLNSPGNPAGNAFNAETLGAICDLVVEENARRKGRERPLFVLYDQVYWTLTFGGLEHVNPVSLRPELREHAVFVDGISKGFAATGMRVGWVVGPTDVISHMNTFLGHVGTWAPRAEQIATANLLASPNEYRAFRESIRSGLSARLTALYDGLMAMKRDGLAVDAISPMGAMYLSARFALHRMRTASGATLRTNNDVRVWLLERAGLAAVPFQAFGGTEDTGWFRLSCGATNVAEIGSLMPRLRAAMAELRPA
jgi:aspartate aminotransferase